MDEQVMSQPIDAPATQEQKETALTTNGHAEPGLNGNEAEKNGEGVEESGEVDPEQLREWFKFFYTKQYAEKLKYEKLIKDSEKGTFAEVARGMLVAPDVSNLVDELNPVPDDSDESLNVNLEDMIKRLNAYEHTLDTMIENMDAKIKKLRVDDPID